MGKYTRNAITGAFYETLRSGKRLMWMAEVLDRLNALQAVAEAAEVVANQRGDAVHWTGVSNHHLDTLRTALAKLKGVGDE